MPFQSIEMMKQSGDIAGLIAALAQRNTAQQAVDALGEIGAPAAEAVVREMADQPQITTYLMAVAAVTKIGVPCLPALVAALNQPETLNRGGAAVAIGMIGEKLDDQAALDGLVEPLLNALADDRPYVREAVLSALGKVGQQLNDHDRRTQIQETLQGYQFDRQRNLSQAAGDALKRLDQPTPAEVAALEAQANAELVSLACPRCGKVGGLVRFQHIYRSDPGLVEQKLAIPAQPDQDQVQLRMRRNARLALWIVGPVSLAGSSFLLKDLQVGLLIGLASGMLAYFITRLAYSVQHARASVRHEQALAQWQGSLYCRECQEFIEKGEVDSKS